MNSSKELPSENPSSSFFLLCFIGLLLALLKIDKL